jgi:hypothetical protein
MFICLNNLQSSILSILEITLCQIWIKKPKKQGGKTIRNRKNKKKIERKAP